MSDLEVLTWPPAWLDPSCLLASSACMLLWCKAHQLLRICYRCSHFTPCVFLGRVVVTAS